VRLVRSRDVRAGCRRCRPHLPHGATRKPLPAPFSDGVTLSYRESDISATGSLVALINSLTAADRDVADRRLNLPVPHAIRHGRYTVYCSVSRLPE
jgi:hypothetical protein